MPSNTLPEEADRPLTPWRVALGQSMSAAVPVGLLKGPLFIFASFAIIFLNQIVAVSFEDSLRFDSLPGGFLWLLVVTLLGGAVGALGSFLLGVPIGAVLIRMELMRLWHVLAVTLAGILAVFAGALGSDAMTMDSPLQAFSWQNIARYGGGFAFFGYFVLGYAFLCWRECSRMIRQSASLNIPCPPPLSVVEVQHSADRPGAPHRQHEALQRHLERRCAAVRIPHQRRMLAIWQGRRSCRISGPRAPRRKTAIGVGALGILGCRRPAIDSVKRSEKLNENARIRKWIRDLRSLPTDRRAVGVSSLLKSRHTVFGLCLEGE